MMLRPFTLRSLLLTAVACVGIWAIVAGACLTIGSTGGVAWPSESATFWARWPIVVSASVVGAALGAAGCVFQAVLRNALADPYLLGVSSGASLMSYLWRFPSLGAAVATAIGATLSLQAFAFAGAMAAVVIVLALSTRRGRLDPLYLLLVGVSVNAIIAAIYLLLNSIFLDLPGSGGATSFLVGGLQTNVTWGQLNTAAVVVLVGVIGLMSLAGGLNVATLGEAEAQALGTRVHRLRWLAMIVASLMTASAVAISGPIGFVGLICPHAGRLIVGTDHRRLLPISAAGGAVLVMVADAMTRYLSATGRLGTALPVGVVTGLMGGPFFLSLLRRRGMMQA